MSLPALPTELDSHSLSFNTSPPPFTNMSLPALPTELDSHIISFLDRPELNALSKVSKYYRSTCEPFLYRHIEFTVFEDVKVRRLLLTLLGRRKLASHITSFCIRHRQDRPATSQISESSITEFHQGLLSRVPDVHRAISDILGPQAHGGEGLEWWEALLNRPDPRAPCDGCVALIVYFASNLEDLVLEYSSLEPLHPTGKVLAMALKESNLGHELHPLSKLRRLCINNRYYQVTLLGLLPSLEEVEICHNATVAIRLPNEPKTVALHTLCFKNPVITYANLETTIETGRLQYLRTLTISRAYQPAWYDYTRLTEAKGAYLPSLEHLHWTCQAGNINFGRFNGLKRLKALHINPEMLAGGELQGQETWLFSNLASILPPNLQVLHFQFRQDSAFRFQGLLAALVARYMIPENIMRLTSALPLRHFSVALDNHHPETWQFMPPGRPYPDFPDAFKALLRSFADALFGLSGMRFEVYGTSVTDNGSKILLVAPGFEWSE